MDDDQLEAWILEQVKGVENDQLVEDNRVELKATWLTDHHKAARQIAGLINASMGKYVLWIVGLDEDEGVVGAEREEVSNWWPQVAKRFDGVPPEPYIFVIPHEKGNLVSLLFRTEGKPFVVTTKEGARPDREVPWREGNRTLSAKQSHLKSLLLTASEMPEIEVIDGWINRGISDLMLYTPQTLKELKLRFSLKLFIFKRQSGILTLPIHRCKVLLVSNNEVLVTWQGPDLTFSSESTKNIEIMPDEVSIFGPGVLKFYTEVDASYLADPPLKLRMSITLDFAETNKHINMDIPFVYSRTSGTTDSGNTYRPLLHRYVLE